jgi:uncharacterized membrane-anchored protein
MMMMMMMIIIIIIINTGMSVHQNQYKKSRRRGNHIVESTSAN